MDPKVALLEYLRAHKLMSLATVGAAGPWICTVFYAVSDDFNIYFLSHFASRHALEITKNEKTAVTITEWDQTITDKKIGVQMEGVTHVVEQGDEHFNAMELWLKTSGAYDDKTIFEQSKVRFMVGTIFRFRPKKTKFLNENLFGDAGIKEIEI